MNRETREKMLVNCARIRQAEESLRQLLATDESSEQLDLIEGHFKEMRNAAREALYGIENIRLAQWVEALGKGD